MFSESGSRLRLSPLSLHRNHGSIVGECGGRQRRAASRVEGGPLHGPRFAASLAGQDAPLCRPTIHPASPPPQPLSEAVEPRPGASDILLALSQRYGDVWMLSQELEAPSWCLQQPASRTSRLSCFTAARLRQNIHLSSFSSRKYEVKKVSMDGPSNSALQRRDRQAGVPSPGSPRLRGGGRICYRWPTSWL